MRYSASLFLIASMLLISSVGIARGEDVKPFDKGLAVAILGTMGYSKVNVGAIVDGLTPGSKMVLAVGVRSGKEVRIENKFEYDSELGWFYFEFQEAGANGQSVNRDLPPGFGGGAVSHVKLRIWSATGYKEVTVGG